MKHEEQKPIRAGVCQTVAQAERTVAALRSAGFTAEEISVICSDDAKAQHFQDSETAQPSGAHSGEALDKAAAGAFGLGTAAVLTALLTSAGTALFVIGAFAGLAAGGTFAGLMATRGIEKETADFYDQALQRGDLLVAVEVHGEHADERLRQAKRVLEQHTQTAAELSEG